MLADSEIRLWQSVILAAIHDANIKKDIPKDKYKKHDMESARNWLLHDDRSYFFVCNMANINPNILRRNFERALLGIEYKSISKEVYSIISESHNYKSNYCIESATI